MSYVFADPWGGGHETYLGYRVQTRPAEFVGTPTMVETFIIEHHFDVDRETQYALPARLVVGTAAAPVPVPEPATLLLLGTGLGAGATRRRLKTRTSRKDQRESRPRPTSF